MNSSQPPWAAQRIVTPDLARQLIESQFPALKPVRLEHFGAGWDNTAYLANGSIVFRFPRREIAAPLLDTECRVLPKLVSRLPLAVPAPEWVGRADLDFPWTFAGYRLIPGRTADLADLDDRARSATARPLAGFLRQLHSAPPGLTGPGDLPLDVIGRLDVVRLAAKIRAALAVQAKDGVVSDPRPALEIVDASAGLKPGDRQLLVHGDLYVRHLIVDSGNRVVGVIDWGDVHLGDPAVDLSLAWSFLPSESRGEFRDAYGPIDDSTWRLARLRALHYGALLIGYGRGIADDGLTREGLSILRFATSA